LAGRRLLALLLLHLYLALLHFLEHLLRSFHPRLFGVGSGLFSLRGGGIGTVVDGGVVGSLSIGSVGCIGGTAN